jgi:hypothetical protein
MKMEGEPRVKSQRCPGGVAGKRLEAATDGMERKAMVVWCSAAEGCTDWKSWGPDGTYLVLWWDMGPPGVQPCPCLAPSVFFLGGSGQRVARGWVVGRSMSHDKVRAPQPWPGACSMERQTSYRTPCEPVAPRLPSNVQNWGPVPVPVRFLFPLRRADTDGIGRRFRRLHGPPSSPSMCDRPASGTKHGVSEIGAMAEFPLQQRPSLLFVTHISAEGIRGRQRAAVHHVNFVSMPP